MAFPAVASGASNAVVIESSEDSLNNPRGGRRFRFVLYRSEHAADRRLDHLDFTRLGNPFGGAEYMVAHHAAIGAGIDQEGNISVDQMFCDGDARFVLHGDFQD